MFNVLMCQTNNSPNIFCIFDGIRNNLNWRYIYKNLFYALNYLSYGVKAWIKKIKNDVNSLYEKKKKKKRGA